MRNLAYKCTRPSPRSRGRMTARDLPLALSDSSRALPVSPGSAAVCRRQGAVEEASANVPAAAGLAQGPLVSLLDLPASEPVFLPAPGPSPFRAHFPRVSLIKDCSPTLPSPPPPLSPAIYTQETNIRFVYAIPSYRSPMLTTFAGGPFLEGSGCELVADLDGAIKDPLHRVHAQVHTFWAQSQLYSLTCFVRQLAYRQRRWHGRRPLASAEGRRSWH